MIAQSVFTISSPKKRSPKSPVPTFIALLWRRLQGQGIPLPEPAPSPL
ncbi:MAG: hypothetical protein JRJ70_08385 [Deltaproteobacteria bacterium]|nr:hypothetical protein [Deltaproteobacteria bacterium]